MRSGWLLTMSLLAGAGCASTSPRESIASVAKLVEERGGAAPHWDRQGPEDAEVEARVHALLGYDLTADGAVEVALLRNRRLIAAYESLGVAQADVVQAGLLKNPTLGAGVGLVLGGAGVTALHGSLTEDFLTIFTIPLRQRFADRALTEAKLRLGAEVLAVGTEVRAALVHLQAAQQAVGLWRSIVDAEGAAAELSARQLRAGNIIELESLQRQAAFEDARQSLARAESEVLDDHEALNRLMGVWGGDTAWNVQAPLPEIPAVEVALEQLESKAIAQRLDLAAARAQTESVSQALSLASGTRLFANLNVGLSADRDPENNRVLGPTLELELPIFDQHQAQLAKLSAQARAAQARQDALAIDIRSEVRVSRNRLLASRAIVEHDRTVVMPLRRRVVKLSQDRYDGMFLGVFALLQAKQAEVAAYRAYLTDVRDYWLARNDLERALGGRIPEARTP
jgi:cobalt-zinc-cadmium efflux system outer membrane protein